MEFHKLDLSKALIIKREVDIALQKLALFNNNINFSNISINSSYTGGANSNITSENNEINKNKLYNSIQLRVQELEKFCEQHYDGDVLLM